MISYVQTYETVGVLLGTYILGESVVLAAAFLAGAGMLSPTSVFITAFVGTLAADITWFAVGEYCAQRHQQVYANLREDYPALFRFIDRLTLAMPLWQSIIGIKFVYGARILFMLYVSVNRLCRPITFILLDAVGVFLWLSLMIIVGYLIGQGVLTQGALAETKWLLACCAMLIFTLKATSLWLKQRLTRE